jgi:SAM-dependent methyltransferase
MDPYTPETYGERIALVYDDLYQGYDERAIAVLKELAGSGPALELGIGTGRIALPLQRAGVEVHGIDASPAMLERLRAKPGGERIPLTVGSFAELPAEGQFTLIYVMFNTFFALLTQEEQVQCFKNAARLLAPGGAFLMEAFIPDLARFPDKQTVRAINVDTNGVQIDVTRVDVLNQHISSQHVVMTENGVRLYPVKLRYAFPAELDLMAHVAGMRLRARWSDWNRVSCSAASGKHISVYQCGAV